MKTRTRRIVLHHHSAVHRQNLTGVIQRSARRVMDVDRLAFVETGDDAMKTRQRNRSEIKHPNAVVATLERNGRIDRDSPDGGIEFQNRTGRRGDLERCHQQPS